MDKNHKQININENLTPESQKDNLNPENLSKDLSSHKQPEHSHTPIEGVSGQTAAFTRALAREIVKNLTSFGEMTARPFRRVAEKNLEKKKANAPPGEFPILVDTSIFIDGRILPTVNSGFFAGTLVVPQFVLGEVQHIADSEDPVRRSKGRRGLEIISKLKSQKSNDRVKVKIVKDDPNDAKEVDHKLVSLAKKWKSKLLTVDYNLAGLARAQGVKVLNINDLAQALKVALVPGEEISIRISHEGKEREQGVGYLIDGTMVIIDHARNMVGQEIKVTVTKIHQTPAGQLFFARIK